ncbi:MAG TPA: peptidyl-prolyl cis-trans isomerase [Terracidiphilus sp.]|nr:peptidyl-prolyl cis-trans isomerase [Terracidiphilus sp.]
MIRFLQRDSRVVKAFFVVIIGMASVSMVVYLIPGLTGQGAASADTYAVIYPHWYSKLLSSGSTVSQEKVDKMARAQLQQQRYPDNPVILGLFEQRVGQQLIQQEILLVEAEKLGIHATADDVRQYLQTGSAGQVLFPGGKFIGDDQYVSLVANRFNMSVAEFEDDVRHDIAIRRLQALITGGVTVSDQEVREDYRKNNIKIKFDYAVISSDDVRKGINPSDSDLEAFFNKNKARYATAVPEERKITYFAFTPNELPGGVPQPTQQEIKAYFDAHQNEYETPEQARSRHILIKVDAGADAKTDAAAKAKAEGILKQLQGSANFADLAKKNSDDPGSKDSGGELPFAQHGTMVPEFDKAIFSQKIGDIAIVKSQFGYHIVQVEERKPAHSQDLNEVLPTIQATLIRQKAAAAEENFAHVLTSEAIKNGLEKAAAAHKLEVVTTPLVGKQGVIAALPDGSQVIARAFEAKQGDPPQYAPTGEGYAIFQVTGIQPAHAPAFADWKTHVLDDYRDEQLPLLLAAKTKELADKAQASHDLAKAAKEVGATVKTSDLVGPEGQVPDLGQVTQVAPQLLDMTVGAISGPISAQRTGVVAKLLDKQEPTADEIAKSFDQTRDQMLEQRRSDAFNVFLSGIMADYKKNKRIRMNPKAQQGPQIPGM